MIIILIILFKIWIYVLSSSPLLTKHIDLEWNKSLFILTIYGPYKSG
jgi:hypothetical protein